MQRLRNRYDTGKIASIATCRIVLEVVKECRE